MRQKALMKKVGTSIDLSGQTGIPLFVFRKGDRIMMYPVTDPSYTVAIIQGFKNFLIVFLEVI